MNEWMNDLQTGDQVKSLEDGVVGTVIEVGYAAVKVRWEDGMTSQIGKRSNVAGRFERVC
jgi:preprotein translocase subunit YajC